MTRVGAAGPSLLDARARRFDGWAPVRSGHCYRANAVAGRTPAVLPDEVSRDEPPRLCVSKRRALHAAAPAWIRRSPGPILLGPRTRLR
jgi:hypothetical protein